MYENIRQIWWSIVIMVVFVTGSELETIPDCVNCKNEQAELGEYIKSQKIAHRLEYIKQQLITNLHVKSVPLETPKFDSLPDFLVRKLVYEDTTTRVSNLAEGVEELPNRQMVLFIEEENTTCSPNTKHGICLNFKFTEEIPPSTDLASAVVWFHKQKFSSERSRTHNFTIIDSTALNAKNRYGKNISTNYNVAEKDGWYQIDVTQLVKIWLKQNVNKNHYLMISCDSCVGTEYATNTTSPNSTKSSFLFLDTQNEENTRLKRGVDCTPGSEECCREDMWIDFKDLGPEYSAMQPGKFNAYVCRGSCAFSSPPDYRPHSDVLSGVKRKNPLSYSMPTTCCTPTKLANFNVVYGTSKLVQRAIIPNLLVESCGCV